MGDTSLNGKLFVAYDASLNSRLVVGSDVTINKRLFTVGDVSFNNGNLFVGLDTSLNGNLVIGKDLTIKGRLNVQNYTNNNIINTTVNNYQLIVSEDLSLNGRLVASGDATINGLTVGRGGGSMTNNTVLGVNSLASNTTGANNTALGANAGTAGTANLTGSNNTFVGYNTQANGSGYTQSTALGAGATITASNQVVLGTTAETVRYNKLSPLYITVPTYTSSDVGYIFSQSSGQVGYSAGTSNLVSISNLALGVYIVKIDMIIFDPTKVGTTSYVDIAIKKNGTTLVYASKAFGGYSATVWTNSPLSASVFLTSNGTDSITVERGSEMGFQAYYYFQYIRIA